jgi:hypothetical protein
MPTLPVWGYAISAVIFGGGLIWVIWKQLRQGQIDKVRADNAEAKIDGDIRAANTEAKLKEARDNALSTDHPDDSW